MVNGKQHSVWFVPTGMRGLPQNLLLNFRLEFPKCDLNIYVPSRPFEILCQMLSTLRLPVMVFVRTHPNLGVLVIKSRSFRDIGVAAPTDFNRGILAGKLDSFRFDFVPVSARN